MLLDLIKGSIKVMNLGARDHAALLVPIADICKQVFERDAHTCHVCGVHVPDMMEIDHLKGHKICAKNDLKCICPFCHNLKHPLWAGARKRIIPIYAPDMSQQDLHRLSWSLVGYGKQEACKIDIAGILHDVKARHEILEKNLGCTDAASLFEAAFSASTTLTQTDTKARDVSFMKIDQFLRFWPAELHWEQGVSNASRLSTWSIGGFQSLQNMAPLKVQAAQKIDPDRLITAGKAILENKEKQA